MATTFSFSDSISLPSSTTATTTLDVGTNPVAIGVIFNDETLGWNHCTLDGQSLITNHVGYGSFLGTDVGMYWNPSPTAMSGTVTFSANQWSSSQAYAAAFVVNADGSVSILDTQGAGTAGLWYGNSVTSAVPGYAMTLGTSAFNVTAQESVAATFSAPDGQIKQVALEDSATSGTRTVGAATLKLAAYFTVVFSTGDIYVEPAASTMTMTAPAPTVDAVDIKVIHQANVMSMVAPDPTITVVPNRVILTTPEHGETPGRIPPPAGMTKPVLTFVDGLYEWVEHDSLVTPVSRLVPLTTVDDSTGEPELVWDDNDELVLTEYFE